MKTSSARLKKFQSEIKKGAFLIEDPQQIFYLLGIKLSLGILVATEKRAALFVDGRYTTACKEKAPCEVFDRNDLAQFFEGVDSLFFDESRITYARYKELQKLPVTLEAAKSPVDEMRWIKEPSEIAAITKSANLLNEGHDYILSILKPGITEIEVARAFHIEMLKRGAEALSFDPIIAFGKNSALPHYHPGTTALKKDDVVLIDIGVVVDDYCSDMTRTHLNGDVPEEMKELYSVTYDAAQAAIALCMPGTKMGALDEAARTVMKKADLEKYFLHTLGHGIGLDVHEGFRIKWDAPTKEIPLKPGMIFTIEPGLYKAGLGGVRHEEMVLVTETGHKILT